MLYFNLKERAKVLTDVGYSWKYDTRGYSVYFNDEFIHGGRILSNAPGPRGWNVKKQLDEYRHHCIITAEKHMKEAGND